MFLLCGESWLVSSYSELAVAECAERRARVGKQCLLCVSSICMSVMVLACSMWIFALVFVIQTDFLCINICKHKTMLVHGCERINSSKQ